MNIKRFCGKGELDAYFGLLFDGLSKVLVAIGTMIGVLGMPKEFVFSRVVPAIALATFIGNTWYFYEAYRLSKKEGRNDVTAQPFGIGASQVFTWLFLIIAPVYWSTGDYEKAWQIGIAACFLGGLIEVFGAYVAPFIKRNLPRSALLGNLAASALIWLTLVGSIIVFDNVTIALGPFLLYVILYYGKINSKIRVPMGLIVVLFGTLLAWIFGYKTVDLVAVEIQNIGVYLPQIAIKDLLLGLKQVAPYLPVIIPLQLGNFITTLQGLQVAERMGDKYPVKVSMVADGLTTVITSIFGSPFPTTVYYGHTTWKNMGAKSFYSLAVGITYLILGTTGLMGLLLAIVPYEVTVILLIVIGVDVASRVVKESNEEYSIVFFISLVPVLVQYVANAVDGILSTFEIEVTNDVILKLGEASVYYEGIKLLSNGALLTSILMAAAFAYIVKQNFRHAGIYMLILAFTTFIGLTHASAISLFPAETLEIGVIYLLIAVLLLVIGLNNGNKVDNTKNER